MVALTGDFDELAEALLPTSGWARYCDIVCEEVEQGVGLDSASLSTWAICRVYVPKSSAALVREQMNVDRVGGIDDTERTVQKDNNQ